MYSGGRDMYLVDFFNMNGVYMIFCFLVVGFFESICSLFGFFFFCWILFGG